MGSILGGRSGSWRRKGYFATPLPAAGFRRTLAEPGGKQVPQPLGAASQLQPGWGDDKARLDYRHRGRDASGQPGDAGATLRWRYSLVSSALTLFALRVLGRAGGFGPGRTWRFRIPVG